MPIDKSSRRIKEVSEQFIIFRSFEGKKLHEDKYLKIILTTEPIFTVCSSVYKTSRVTETPGRIILTINI